MVKSCRVGWWSRFWMYIQNWTKTSVLWSKMTGFLMVGLVTLLELSKIWHPKHWVFGWIWYSGMRYSNGYWICGEPTFLSKLHTPKVLELFAIRMGMIVVRSCANVERSVCCKTLHRRCVSEIWRKSSYVPCRLGFLGTEILERLGFALSLKSLHVQVMVWSNLGSCVLSSYYKVEKPMAQATISTFPLADTKSTPC